MNVRRHSEAAFETVIEEHLLAHGYIRVAPTAYDKARAIFPDEVLAFVRATQAKEWARLESLHGEQTGEQILERHSVLDLLARFVHLQIDEKRDDQGRKVRTEAMIFPRYHQLQAVRILTAAARDEGPGHNQLVEHSAGSGKSNTIGWLAHRLAALHDEHDPETGERFTVKRYESRKAPTGDSWSHGEVTLRPVNPDYPPIVISANDGERLAVVAELVEVLKPAAPAS